VLEERVNGRSTDEYNGNYLCTWEVVEAVEPQGEVEVVGCSDDDSSDRIAVLLVLC